LNFKEAGELCQKIVSQVSTVIVGKNAVLEKVMLAILANSHILFEDNPGLAKTLLARSFAMSMGCNFSRVQFTPDLLPADITGTYIYNVKTGEFELRRGPVFTNVLLADEVNRAPPKTQAALLEAMQERQATLDGKTHPIRDPFIVIATQNPIEYEGVYPLPEAQLDRFMVKLRPAILIGWRRWKYFVGA
jgi:MoxR-like ATPase